MANIKADSALISAAGAAAKSAGPISMQSSVDRLVTTHGFVMNQVADSWAQTMKSFEFEKNAASQEMAKLEESLIDGSMPFEEQQDYEDFIQKQRNSIKGSVDELRETDEFQDMAIIGGGRRKARKKAREDARKKAIYELNQAVKFRQKDSDEGLSMTNKLKPENLPLLAKNTDPMHLEIAKEWAKVTRGEESELMTKELVDGRMVYTFKSPELKKEDYTSVGRDGTRVFEERLYNLAKEKHKQIEFSGTTEDINKLIRPKDLTSATGVNKIIGNAQKYAFENKDANINDIFNRVNNDIITTFSNNPTGYTDAMYETMGNQEQSIADALHTPGTAESLEIHAALKQIARQVQGVEGFRINDDNVIDAKDFNSPENYRAFVKEILDPSDENKKLVYRWAAGAIMRTEVDKAFGVGEKQRNINNQKDPRDLTAGEIDQQLKDKIQKEKLDKTTAALQKPNFISIVDPTDPYSAIVKRDDKYFLVPINMRGFTKKQYEAKEYDSYTLDGILSQIGATIEEETQSANSLDLPDDPKQEQIKLIMNSNPNLTREQAEKLYKIINKV